MKRLLVCILLSVTNLVTLCAQSLIERMDSIAQRQVLAKRIDSLITKREAAKNYDTLYIQRPKQNWTIRTRLNATQWKLRSVRHDGASSVFESNMKYTISLGVGYRGIMLGLSINPSKLSGKNSDTEYGLVSYGNRFGGEVFFHHSKNFNAKSRFGDFQVDASDGIDYLSMFNASGYYVFNAKRFSYPAAFCQSYIQRRSAGSWLLGMDAFYAEGHVKPIPEVGIADTRLQMFMFGIGAGYGYNFVLPHRWLIHLSAVPTVVIAQHNTMTVDGHKERMKYRFPELLSACRFSVVHSFNRYFVGVTATFHINTLGNHNDLFLENLKWKARAVIGMRL